jgi:NAD(P)-dependent dehydrogenase (short-subunit alcohol dehydrogenase family)
MAAPLVRGYADSVVLVAGGTSGVGLASAIGFAEAGVRRMALLARNPERGEAARQAVLARCPQAEVLFVPVDAGDAGQVGGAVATVHDRFGQIDVAVSSVTGSYRPELLHRTPVEDLATIVTQQALPPMLLTRLVLPLMQEQGGGSIVNIASDAAKVPTPGERSAGQRPHPVADREYADGRDGAEGRVQPQALREGRVCGAPGGGGAGGSRVDGRLPGRAGGGEADRAGHLGQRRHLGLVGQMVQLTGWLTIGVKVTPTATISPRASTVISFSPSIWAAWSLESQTLIFTIEPSGETPAYQ